MKISIASGGVMFDIDCDSDQIDIAVRAIAQVLVRELGSVENRQRASEKRKPFQRIVGSLDGQPRPGGFVDGTQSLNAIQFETWKYLKDNDVESGIHLSAVARALSVTDGAAGCRCSTLVKLGFAKRTREGYYRAVGNRESSPGAATSAGVPTPRDVAVISGKKF